MLKTLREEHQFAVTRKQINTKIAEWKNEGFLPAKNISKVDMGYMVRIQYQHEDSGQHLEFKYRGSVVDEEKLTKHRKRYGIQQGKHKSNGTFQCNLFRFRLVVLTMYSSPVTYNLGDSLKSLFDWASYTGSYASSNTSSNASSNASSNTNCNTSSPPILPH
jgi:hypothetical protein